MYLPRTKLRIRAKLTNSLISLMNQIIKTYTLPLMQIFSNLFKTLQIT